MVQRALERQEIQNLGMNMGPAPITHGCMTFLCLWYLCDTMVRGVLRNQLWALPQRPCERIPPPLPSSATCRSPKQRRLVLSKEINDDWKEKKTQNVAPPEGRGKEVVAKGVID